MGKQTELRKEKELLPQQTAGKRAEKWAPLRRLLYQAGALLLGMLFASACIREDICPFGVSYLAAAGHPAPAAVGAFCRYVLRGGQRGLLYGAACAVVLTCRLVLEGTAVARKKWFFPTCAMIAVFSTGLVLVEGGKSLLALGVQTLLCGFFARILKEAGETHSPLRGWGRLAAMLAGILAFLPYTLPGGMRPARILAAMLILSVSCGAGGLCGGLLGSAYGAAIDVSLGQNPFFVLVWGISAIAGGAGMQKERLPTSLRFSIVSGLLCLWLYQLPYAGAAFYEGLLAGAIFILLPRRLWLQWELRCDGLKLQMPAGRSAQSGNARAISDLSFAIRKLGLLLESEETLEGELPKPEELGQIFRKGCELSCRSCVRAMDCWQQNYEPMRDMLCHLRQPLERKHCISPSDLPSWFAGRCLAPSRFCGGVNDAYRDALRRRAMHLQQQSLYAAMGKQYAGLGSMLEGAMQKTSAFDPQQEGQITRIVRAYLPGARVSVCKTGGRMQLDILLKKPAPELLSECETLRKTLQKSLSVQLLPPETVESTQGTVLRLRQQERCSLRLYAACAQKDGETVSGDAYRVLHTDDGRAAVLLSDGMGSGQTAGLRANQALELLCSFVSSGCSLCESVSSVLPVLAARFPQWGFVTLDLVEVNLFSGKCSMLKYGAAPGFLLHQGRLTRFDSHALPAGLAEGGQARPFSLCLAPGDRVVLFSDGAFLENEASALLRREGTMEGQALADALLQLALAGGAQDDRTVLVADFVE